MNVPELTWYTNVEIFLDPSIEANLSFDKDEDEIRVKLERNFKKWSSTNSFKSFDPARPKRVLSRRISVSSSRSDDDIGEILTNVVRGSAAARSRTTYHA